MNQVFEKTSIAGMTLENRIFRSGAHEGMGLDDGRPDNDILTVYERLAKNKVGAIITGIRAVQQNGRIFSNMCLFDSDSFIDSYKPLVAKVREHDVPLILQIVHGGGQCLPDATKHTVAPSSISYSGYPKPRAMSELEIEEVVNSFVKAIVRARKAEFSGVQIHAAHGFLLSAFLSPHFNRRKDRWGGTTDNRFRIVGEIIRRARQQVGDYPILVKISAYDGFKDGATIEESVQIARKLQEVGCDAIEVSCGNSDWYNTIRVTKIPIQAVLHFNPRYSKMPFLHKKFLSFVAPWVIKRYQPLRNYNVEAARKIKEHVTVPVIVVGGIRRLKDIEEIIGENKADYVSMGRPFVIEPDIVARFFGGQQEESRCLNCGYCVQGVSNAKLKCYYGRVSRVD
jgi:2,4-dienoyl-CoA reductase-like NADH-dependent reductase (Old Yellow Enzyme family)